MTAIVPPSRRVFLAKIFSAGALVLATPLLPAQEAANSAGSNGIWQPSVYLGIEPSGVVKIVAHRSEMGTGCRTALPMIVADELEADWNRVQVVQAPGDLKYGSQNTDGSCSVRDFYDALRAAGASARNILERAAAGKWGVPEEECQGQNHFVVHTKTGRKLSYGELVPLASASTAPTQNAVRLKRPEQFRYIGKDVPMVDLAPIVAGKATFGIDVKRPGMVYAAIERPPFIGSALKSCDDAAAKQVKGVQRVVMLDLAKPPYGFQALGGAAVIADNTWSALQGRRKLKVDWNPGENAVYDSTAYKTALLDTVKKPGRVARETGDVDAEFAKGAKIVEASYYTPMLAHGPAQAHFRIGWLRSVSNIYHAFAVQSFTDELAAAAGRDRVEYLLDIIGQPRVIDFAREGLKQVGPPNPKFPFDTQRLRNVIELAAQKSGWANKKAGGGRALGIAAHRSFLTYVAVVAEVEAGKGGAVRIPRIDIAVDAGRLIDPDRVKAQFEGAAVFGAGIALMSEVTAAGGRIQQSNFDGYRVPRINESPVETYVHLVNGDAAPAGVGEPGVPPIAPALCSAIFAATGKRIRELPIAKQLV